MKEKLTARRQQVSDRFDELLKSKQQKENEIADIDAELAKLQGAYRELTSLIEEETDEASTIDVDKALKEKKDGK